MIELSLTAQASALILTIRSTPLRPGDPAHDSAAAESRLASAIREESSSRLWLALLLYATACTAVLLCWPGTRSRYALPAVLAVASLAGLLFARMRPRHSRTFKASDALIALLAAYQLLLGWVVIPNFSPLFAHARVTGEQMARVMNSAPAPLYAVEDARDLSPMVYVPAPIRQIPFERLPGVSFPAWAWLRPQEVSELQARHPELDVDMRLILPEYENTRLVYIRRQPQ